MSLWYDGICVSDTRDYWCVKLIKTEREAK